MYSKLRQASKKLYQFYLFYRQQNYFEHVQV